MRRRAFNATPVGATEAPPTIHAGNTPYYPLELTNGNLTGSPNRRNPSTDLDANPRFFQRYINTGFESVQMNNGLHRRIGSGLFSRAMLSQANYLSTIVPQIPGQMRDNWGGFQPKGIDPQSYAALVANGPGAQPVNPGGVGQIAANYYVNPYAGGG